MSATRSRVTTHVLDAVSGRIGRLGPDDLDGGVYRVTFGVGDYFAGRQQEAFNPEVVISFTLDDPAGHCHVPLLVSPFVFSTYRGS